MQVFLKFELGSISHAFPEVAFVKIVTFFFENVRPHFSLTTIFHEIVQSDDDRSWRIPRASVVFVIRASKIANIHIFPEKIGPSRVFQSATRTFFEPIDNKKYFWRML